MTVTTFQYSILISQPHGVSLQHCLGVSLRSGASLGRLGAAVFGSAVAICGAPQLSVLRRRFGALNRWKPHVWG